MFKTRFIVGVLVLFYLVRLFLINRLELAPDESYYWYWAQHLDLSYFDHPPMVAYIMAVFTFIFGDNEFGVRSGGLLLSLAMLFLLWRSLYLLQPGDRKTPWKVVFIANATLLFSAGCLIQTPDTPLMFFWAAAVYCGIEIIRDGRPYWWYLWGVAVGLGLLSKYSMILIVPCQFAFMLLASGQRFRLLRKEPYVALLIALFIFSPVLWWNRQHDWMSFAFQLKRGLEPGWDLSILKLLEYIGGQAGIITPLIFIAFIIASVKALRVYLHERRPEYLYLLMLSWPVIIFFGYSSMRGYVAQPNWPAPAYMAGFLLLVLAYSRHFSQSRPHRIFLATAAGLALILNIALHIHLIRPYLPVSPKIDTTQQFHGWRALGLAVNQIIDNNPHAAGYFLLADRGTTVAGAVFYTHRNYIGIDFSRPERYTFLKNLEGLRGKNAIILLHHVSDAHLQLYRPYFRELIVLGKQDARFRGEIIEEYSVYLVLGKEYSGAWRPGKVN